MAYPWQVSIGVWPHLNSSNFVLRLDDLGLSSTGLEYKTSDRCHPNDAIADDLLVSSDWFCDSPYLLSFCLSLFTSLAVPLTINSHILHHKTTK